jgi:hypothetical protein
MAVLIVDRRVVKVGAGCGAPDEETCRIESHFSEIKTKSESMRFVCADFFGLGHINFFYAG